MAEQADFDALIERFNVATSRIAEVIRDLRDQLANGGLTPEQEADVLARFGGVADALDALGADPENPVPPEA